MRVLVTGAGGQLGTDLVRRVCVAAGDEVAAAPSSDARRRRPRRRARHGAVDAHPTPSCTPRRGPRSTPARPTPTRPAASTPSPCATSPRPAGGRRPPGARVDRLRVRRRAGAARTSSGTRRTRSRRTAGRSSAASSRRSGACPGATIVRTSWVCGAHGGNMVQDRARLWPPTPTASWPSSTTSAAARRSPSDLAPAAAPPGGRAPARAVPRHQPGRGQLVRVRAGDPRRRPAARADRVRPIADRRLDPPRPAPRPANSVLDSAALALAGIAAAAALVRAARTAS